MINDNISCGSFSGAVSLKMMFRRSFRRLSAGLFSGMLPFALAVLTGCSGVAVQDASAEQYAKQFNPPPKGWAGLYVYRTGNIFGGHLKKSLYVDGQYIGETSTSRFFYRLVKPGTHTLQTESEFSENDLRTEFKAGTNVYVKQVVRPGVFVYGAKLKVMDPGKAQSDILDYSLAENTDNPALNLKSFTGKQGDGSVPGPKNAEEASKIKER